MSPITQTRKPGLREGSVSPAQGSEDRTAEVDLLVNVNDAPTVCLVSQTNDSVTKAFLHVI